VAIDHERHMRLALAEAARAHGEGNLPVGAVIVRDGAVLARGRSQVNSTFDVTAHAEMVVIRDLCKTKAGHEPAVSSQRRPAGRLHPLHDRRAVSDVRLGRLHSRPVGARRRSEPGATGPGPIRELQHEVG
jgi:hypothetical protein